MVNMQNDGRRLPPVFARWASVASLIGIGMVFLARLVRPLPAGTHPALAFLIGVLPNLGAGLALPFAAVFWAFGIMQLKRWTLAAFFYGMVGLTLSGLLGWEIVQLVVWGYSFDVYDLVATAIGVAGTVLIFRLFAARSPAAEVEEWADD